MYVCVFNMQTNKENALKTYDYYHLFLSNVLYE